MDYKSVFTNLCLEHSTEQVVDKGIKQKSTKEWTHSLTAVPFCPGAPKACSLGLRETPACIHVIQPFVTATSGVLTRLPAKLSKNGMHVQTSAERRSKIKLRGLNGLREAKGLKQTHLGRSVYSIAAPGIWNNLLQYPCCQRLLAWCLITIDWYGSFHQYGGARFVTVSIVTSVNVPSIILDYNCTFQIRMKSISPPSRGNYNNVN